MFSGLPTMAEAQTYEDETKRMSPAVKDAIDRILSRMSRRGQCGRSVSIWDCSDILEDLIRVRR